MGGFFFVYVAIMQPANDFEAFGEILPMLLAALGPLYLLCVAWPLAKTDIRERRLPNRLVLPAFPIAIFGQALASGLTGHWLPMLISSGCAIGTLVAGLLISSRASLGMGDVKLMSAMVLALGWFSPLAPLFSVMVSFALASAIILIQVIRRKANMGSSIALGPYLLAGFTATSIGLVWS